MDEYCAFSKYHKCIKWEDYELTRHELEEADALCHSNWIEIQQLQKYITILKRYLTRMASSIRITDQYR